MNETEAFFNRGGPPALSFHDRMNPYQWANVWRGGLVLGEPILRRVVDPNTKEIKTWDDGSERLKMVVTLECVGGPITLPDGTVAQVHDERDPTNPKDVGHRRLFIQGYMVDGVRTAVHAAGARGVSPGGRLYVAWTDEKPSKNPTFGPGKIFSGLYVVPAIAVPQGATPPQNGLASQQGGTPFGHAPGSPPPFGAPSAAQPAQQPAAVTAGPAFGQAVQAAQQQAAQTVTALQQAGYQGPAYAPPGQATPPPFGQPAAPVGPPPGFGQHTQPAATTGAFHPSPALEQAASQHAQAQAATQAAQQGTLAPGTVQTFPDGTKMWSGFAWVPVPDQPGSPGAPFAQQGPPAPPPGVRSPFTGQG